MTSITVELPNTARAFLDEEVASGRCATHAEFIEQLVRAEQKRRAQDQIARLALEALETPATPWTKGSSMDEIRSELRNRRSQTTAE